MIVAAVLLLCQQSVPWILTFHFGGGTMVGTLLSVGVTALFGYVGDI